MAEYLPKSIYKNSTLVELLQKRAFHQPEQRAFTFLADGATDQAHLTYSELDRQAQTIAAWLQRNGTTGERVLLLYKPGLEFIAAFFGCLYAGCIAIPTPLPPLNRPMPRVQAIVVDAQATIALTTHDIFSKLERRLIHTPELASLNWQATDSLSTDLAVSWQPASISGDSLAFLQYTSGSTASPKGVMVSHSNLIHNLEYIRQAVELNTDSVSVSWLPSFHDMGLIDGILQPLYTGYLGVLMSPISFLQQPVRWLRAISQYRATHSGGPNFAYELCINKVSPEQRSTLDLSCWRNAYSGAEPVRADTVTRFSEMFAPCGFQAEFFYPCYGLAEATLMVSGGTIREKPVFCAVQTDALAQNKVAIDTDPGRQSKQFVGCGVAWLDTKIVVANPDTHTLCAADEIGEIWVSGSGVAQGYWNNSQETQHTFQAYLADTGAGPFLRTGDLGFLKDGELFVTGRLKDLLIIRGRNYYPQDIELTAEQSHPALRSGSSAACSVEVSREERLVIVQELKREHRYADLDEVVRSIRGAVLENFELLVYAVVLIKPGTISKTSSGKIQRHVCRARFLADELDIIESSVLDESYFSPSVETDAGFNISPRSPTEELVVEIFSEVLGVEDIGVYDNFFNLGGQSLLATQVISRVRETFQIEIPLSSIFEKPTSASLARNIEAARLATQAVQLPAIVPVPRTEALPLSFSQERMWFLNQLDPEGSAYNTPVAIRFVGSLNVTALAQSLNETVHRHEILRTTFVNTEDGPTQVIAANLTAPIVTVDLQEFPQNKRELEARRLASEEAKRPFDLTNGPLIRFTLFRLGSQEHVMLVAMHHIITDAWSFSVFWQEFATLYKAFSVGESLSLPELPIQYADFARWQRQWLRGSVLETQMAYWQQQLNGAQFVLELPADHARPSLQTFRGANQSLPVRKSLLESLRRFGHQENASLFMTLLTAFNILLYRYSQQKDILVGTPVANRQWLAVEGVLGSFVNTLVMRTDLSGNPTFRDLLRQVREVALAAYAHQDLPFEQLVEKFLPQRGLSHTPLFQVTFSMANAPMPIVELPNLCWDIFDIDRAAAQFDLSLLMVDTKQVQLMSMEYNTDLFEHATISRMMTHFQTLLEGINTNPDQHLSDLPLLSDDEKQQVLIDWNRTEIEYPKNVCLHHLFETQAAQTPDAVAVVFPATNASVENLTYAELNSRANQLANYLQEIGVKPDVLVGLCVERSVEMVIGLLGVLKAGGAYVPLDPEYPPERLAFMLEDANVAVLLTQEKLLNQLPERRPPTICLDSDRPTFSQYLSDPPTSAVSADNLAYVIYTSGSTGKPKGAMISHRAICNHMLWMQDVFPLIESDRILQKTPFSFDASVWEFYAPLLAGARLVIAKPHGHRDPSYLVQLLVEQKITVLQLVPSLLSALLNEEGFETCTSLKRVFCGGEALSGELQQRFFSRLPATCLFNLYGPAEATIDTTVWECRKEDNRSNVPIGRPIANMQTYVLDSKLQPVPIGVPGELHIGGVGLARGYYLRPDLTAEKFIPNPFSQTPGERLYKTGDLVRYLPDGALEFLGRIDHQVKIRGYRIELGEIEFVLRQHPSVRDAAVIVWKDAGSDGRLVAYLILNQNKAPITNELRRFVRQKLPDYMTPSIFVMLDALPLNPSGKVDRRALPEPDKFRPQLDENFVAPRSVTEERLVEIWSRLLEINKIGVYDNFFNLGGHSLLVARLRSQVRESFQIELPLRNFFETPTIAELAVLIEDRLIAELDELTEDEAERLINRLDRSA